MDIDLAAYFDQQPRGAMKRMADDLGVPAAMISQWAAGTRPIHPRYVPKIERMTGMLVRRWTMCPDWADIWEELIGHPEAPRVGVCISDSSADQPRTEEAAGMTGANDFNWARPASPSADVVSGESAAGPSPTPFHAASVTPCAGVCPVGPQAGRVFSDNRFSSGDAPCSAPSSVPCVIAG